ncbi:MAG: hypothetical protein IPP72_02940 [Chitinophagaceae bacterium]|nr:hypothetical protein [Chitinophagaceae bacterium]
MTDHSVLWNCFLFNGNFIDLYGSINRLCLPAAFHLVLFATNVFVVEVKGETDFVIDCIKIGYTLYHKRTGQGQIFL